MKTLILLISLAMPILLSAQSYKVKNGTLYRDKLPIAIIKGEVGSFKGLDMSLETLDGQVIFSAKGGAYVPEYPGMYKRYWITYDFPDQGKKIIAKRLGEYMSEQQFLKFEFFKKGVDLTKDGISEEGIAYFESLDYSTVLHEDTLEMDQQVQFFQTNLSDNEIDRVKSDPIVFRVPRNGQKGEYLVVQGFEKDHLSRSDEERPIIIGKILIDHEQTETRTVTKQVWIYKKLKESATDADGNKVEYLEAATVNLMEGIPNLFLYETGNEVSHINLRFDSGKSPRQNAKAAIEYMIRQGLY